MIVRWPARAVGQLQDIVQYIAQDNRAAAVELARDVIERARQLEQFPYLGGVGRDPDTRELVVRRNYLIVYQVFAAEIVVVQVWHAARERRPRMRRATRKRRRIS